MPGLTGCKATTRRQLTAVSTGGTDSARKISLALAQAGCPVLSLSAETMSLEDVFPAIDRDPGRSKPETTPPPKSPETQTEGKGGKRR